MQYCTNCGSVLSEGTKFCSDCGEKVSLSSGDGKKTPKKKSDSPLMEKGVIKSLKKGTTDHIKSKIQKSIKPNSEISKSTKKTLPNQEAFQRNSTNEISGRTNPAKKLMIFYFLLNIPLYFINTGDDEIMGILIFSVIIIVSYLFRMKKEKPFHIILKIIMGLQLLLMLASLMLNFEIIGSTISSVIAVITLLLLIYITGKLVIKGNKTN